MIPFNKCPVCGGEVIEKDLEKLLRGGKNTAVVKIKAEVCTIVVKDCTRKIQSAILSKFVLNLSVTKYQNLNSWDSHFKLPCN